jgi:hypothetical protein
MARTTANFLPVGVILSLSLDRYQEIMRLPAAAFNGLNKPDDPRSYSCATIWKQTDRDNLAQYLSAAEEMREKELGYFLGPKYIVAERHDLENPSVLNRKHLIALGTETITDIEDAVSITLSDNGGVHYDPVTIVVATAVTIPSEIVVCYPGEDEYIHPASVVIAGGNATITIARSRLIDPSLNDDRDDPLQYDDDANFLDEVDVKRRYTDLTDGTSFYYTDDSYVEQTYTGHGVIRENRQAIVEAYVSPLVCINICYEIAIRFNYLSGIRYTIKMLLETARLAHTLMPWEPCHCDPVQQMWIDDRTQDPVETLTPYGSTKGAVNAWLADSRSKIGFGGIFR